MIRVPCGRSVHLEDLKYCGLECNEQHLCANCSAIRTLKATCLGAADYLENLPGLDDQSRKFVNGWLEKIVGRLRADVARVEGRTE